ncbi:hypothetical protein MA16_Dca008576 [Dendrobium catenatum]|uniref:Uncharacterized protein n=1 Tax=Dendrobium catenatum TaxID=906689 RepID=A0A2I0WA36_9ASPA|nr:hypothetical protein MA16_Dca008576 [Dendrobium catenatum]
MFDEPGIRSRDSGISEEKIFHKEDGTITAKGISDLMKIPSFESDKMMPTSNLLGAKGAKSQEDGNNVVTQEKKRYGEC